MHGRCPLPGCLVGCPPSAFTPRRAARPSLSSCSGSSIPSENPVDPFPAFSSPGACFFRSTPPTIDFCQKPADGLFCFKPRLSQTSTCSQAIGYLGPELEPVEILGSSSEPLSPSGLQLQVICILWWVEKDHHMCLSVVQLGRALDGDAEV